MTHRDDLLMRKARLAERIAGQRARLSEQMDSVQPLIRLADKGLSALRTAQAHPGWVAAGVGVLIALRPKRAITALRRGFFIWRTYRWTRQALAGALAQGLNRY